MTKEEFYSRTLSFDEVGEQVDIFKKEKIKYEQEIERLNNIINEAIEYIEERYNGEVLTHTFDKDNVGELLEILDKINKEKNNENN